jgi:hypothetical protein
VVEQGFLGHGVGAQPDRLTGLAAIEQADHFGKGRCIRDLFNQATRRGSKPIAGETVARFLRKVSHVKHVVLDKVVEENGLVHRNQTNLKLEPLAAMERTAYGQ